VSAAATAQAGADASLKIAANLGDLADAAASRTNLGVDSSGEVDSKVSTAVGAAQSALQTNIDGVSGRVTTLEGQNLDSRLSSAEGTIAGLGTMSTQNADNITITGGSIGAGSVPTDSGVILTENSTIDGGTFSGFNGGGGGGGATSYAASFDGNSSLSLPDSLGLGAGDFTVEAFINRSGNAGVGHILCDQANGLVMYAVGEAIYFGQVNAGLLASGPMSSANAWHHVALVRESGAIALYVDGVQVAGSADSTDLTAVGPAEIGALFDQSGNFYGKVANLRISSTARYAGGSFTVPTSAFTADGYTGQLLLQSSSVDGSLNPHGNVTMVAGPF
jgi:hypothetical protein